MIVSIEPVELEIYNKYFKDREKQDNLDLIECTNHALDHHVMMYEREKTRPFRMSMISLADMAWQQLRYGLARKGTDQNIVKDLVLEDNVLKDIVEEYFGDVFSFEGLYKEHRIMFQKIILLCRLASNVRHPDMPQANDLLDWKFSNNRHIEILEASKIIYKIHSYLYEDLSDHEPWKGD